MNLEGSLARVRRRVRRIAGLESSAGRGRVPWRAMAVSLSAVVLLTLLLHGLAGDLDLIDSALLYLLLVFGIALFFGSTPAVVAALVAFLSLNLGSVPPTGSLSIDNAEHLVALLVYLGVAIVTGRLVATEADRSRQIERERERAELLAQSDNLKSALISAVSHELRSPLATIKTSASALLDPAIALDGESRRELLHAIDEEADRLNAVVGNLLDLSRIEGGALRPNREWCDVEELAFDVVERLRRRGGSHPITLAVQPDLPLVWLDYVEIAQVLMNLGDNAIKYTPAGTAIHIEVSRQGESLLLAVRDQGPGIPAEDIERVFERFWRADRPGMSAGAGIGLTISRGLVEAHGGTIDVASEPGQGATFTVRLPLAPGKERAE